MRKQPCVYIMSNRLRGVLYVGVTSSIIHRVWQHRTGMMPGFTCKYRLNRLVYFEFLASFPEAICREKQIKRWRRKWKIELVEANNPKWRDLYPTII
ncbi:MAG: GIY-YIG nuclease family protein [Xanthomonadales bacterium]|nr:GIY-YIG nuclease family protein [Xanthomonadales bacterium]